MRVVIDGYGGKPLDSSIPERLRDAGCDVRWFRPLSLKSPMRNNHRTHRKLLIVDGSVGFTGGVGIADEWRGDARNADEWRDSHFRFEGPVVRGLHSGFYDNWIEASGELPDRVGADPDSEINTGADTTSDTFHQDASTHVLCGVVSSPSQRFSNTLHTHFDILFSSSAESLDLCTAYFMPDERLISTLERRVAEGVKVRILLPGPHLDKQIVNIAARPILQRLVDSGCVIRLYQRSMLHAKTLIVDGSLVSIGSANMNRRSTSSDEELNVVMSSSAVGEELTRWFEADWAEGVDLADSHYDDPSAARTAMSTLLRPFRKLM